MARFTIKGFDEGLIEGIGRVVRDSAGRLRNAQGKFLSKAQIKLIQDSDWLVPLPEIMKDLEEQAVEVGFFSDEVAQRAMYNEFGTERIPARPFMRTAFDANVQRYQDLARARIGDAVDGTVDALKALIPVGNQVRNDVIRSINSWQDPPNAAATIREKGANNPLVDTGEMQRNVEIKVRGNGGGFFGGLFGGGGA